MLWTSIEVFPIIIQKSFWRLFSVGNIRYLVNVAMSFFKIEYNDFGCVGSISGTESGIGEHSSISGIFHCVHFILFAMVMVQIHFSC